jgi:hypothetical protein
MVDSRSVRRGPPGQRTQPKRTQALLGCGARALRQFAVRARAPRACSLAVAVRLGHASQPTLCADVADMGGAGRAPTRDLRRGGARHPAEGEEEGGDDDFTCHVLSFQESGDGEPSTNTPSPPFPPPNECLAPLLQEG